MGKCVRIRGSSKPPADAASSCLTLRSGRRVPPVAVAAASSACRCSPRTSGRPRRHRGSATLLRCAAAEAATADKQRGCGSPRHRTADDAGSPARGPVLVAQRLYDDDDGRRPEAEVMPPSQAADTGARGVEHGCGGDSFERPKTPLVMTNNDCDDAAVAKVVTARHESESRCRKGVVAGQPPPTEAEMEAFFAAAELAERRRFAEAYNYDVALDRPLEGRFEWAPVST